MTSPNNPGQHQYDPAKIQDLNIPDEYDRSEFNKPTSAVNPGDQWAGPIIPRSYSIEMAEEKGLAADGLFNERFFTLQALYRNVLEAEIISKYDLRLYDDAIGDSSFQFRAEQPERMSFYQKYSTLDTRYIYLRNNIHIERLSEEQLALLDDYLLTGGDTTKKQLEALIAETYRMVLMVDPSGGNFLVGYAGGGGITAPNVSIVFEISFSGFDYDAGDGYDYIDSITEDMGKKLSTSEMPVTVFCE